MKHEYDNQYAVTNVYGHAVDLAGKFGLGDCENALFIDFGCGYGRIAEELRDKYKVKYLGVDVGVEGLESLRSRGFTALEVDLRDPELVFARICDEITGGAKIAALCIIDTLEHLAQPAKILNVLRELALKFHAPLIASVPNFKHRDIGFKLALGKFEYTKTGLLDHTHFQYFTDESFTDLMRGCGWYEVYRNDVTQVISDQHFPVEHAALARHAPLHNLLAGLRSNVDEFGTVNQLVRAYLPGPQQNPGVNVPYRTTRDEPGPFLTVLIRTTGTRTETLREVLLCLSSQTNQDFDVCIAGHNLDLNAQLSVERLIADLHDSFRTKVIFVRIDGGTRASPLNEGFEKASGKYVVVLDDDDLVFGHWVDAFHRLAANHSGQVLRQVAVAQDWDKPITVLGGRVSRAVGGMRAIYAKRFDLIEHLGENRSPLHTVAFPRSLFRDLGIRFDEDLTTTEDWDFIVRVTQLAGVAGTEEVGCIYRHWKGSESSYTLHAEEEWRANYLRTISKLDNVPLLLPSGSVSRINELMRDLARFREASTASVIRSQEASYTGIDREYWDMLQSKYHALVNSTSWRITSPLRFLKRIMRLNWRGTTPKVWLLSVSELESLIDAIEASTSWRITTPIRGLRRLFRS